MNNSRRRRAGELKGLSIGTSRAASTAWIQYYFNDKTDTVTIQIYRFSWVVWEKTSPTNNFAKLRAQAVLWCKDWKFQYVRERVLAEMSERTILKHQDGSPVE